MKAFLANLSQLFHINRFAKKGTQRERELAFTKSFVTYLIVIKYVYARFAVLKFIEKSINTPAYLWVDRESQLYLYLT